MIPSWIVQCMALLALFALVLGRWRWASWLAAPAITRYILWPLLWSVIEQLPPIVLILLAILLIPLLILRLIHRAIAFATSTRAADHATGEFLAHTLLRMTRRGRRRG